MTTQKKKSRNSSVGIVVRLQPGKGEAMDCLWPTQPPVQQVLEVLSPGIKQPAYKADHPQPSTAKVKISSNTTYSQLSLHGMHWNNIPTTRKDDRLKIKENFNLYAIYISLLFKKSLLNIYLFLATCVCKTSKTGGFLFNWYEKVITETPFLTLQP